MEGRPPLSSFFAQLSDHADRGATWHAAKARGWRRTLIALLLVAAVLAGLAAFFAFRQDWSPAIGVGGGAAFVLLLGALLRPDALRDEHQRAARRYRSIENESEALATLEPVLDDGQRSRWLVSLSRRWDTTEAAHPTDKAAHWWEWTAHATGVGSALVAVAAAALIGAGVGLAFRGSTPPEAAPPPGGPPPTPSDTELVARFAPVLKLSRDELFVPIDRPRYIEVTRLLLKPKLRKAISLPFDGLEAGLPETRTCPGKRSCRLHLDIRGLKPKNGLICYRRLQDEIIAPAVPAPLPPDKRCTPPPVPTLVSKNAIPTVYWHVWRDTKEDDVAIQYWFLYLFNGFENWHEADWEQITVRLEGGAGRPRPEAVFYSAHQGGHFRDWEPVEKLAGTHPVVFVARGSHANYFVAGIHPVELVCLKKLRALGASVCARVNDTADGCGPTLVPGGTGIAMVKSPSECTPKDAAAGKTIAYALAELGRPSFDGDYGYGNYLLHGRVPIGERGPEEPQRRSEWRNPIKVFAKAHRG